MAGKGKGNMSALITVIAIVVIIVVVMVFSFLQWAFLQSGTYSVTYKSGKALGSIEMQPFGACVLTVDGVEYDCTWAPADYNMLMNTGAYTINYTPDAAGVITIAGEEIECTVANQPVEVLKLTRATEEGVARFVKS